MDETNIKETTNNSSENYTINNEELRALKEDIMSTTLDDLESFDVTQVPSATEEQKTEQLKSSLSNEYNLSDSDIAVVLDIISRRKNGEEVDILEELPIKLKAIISKLCAANGISSKEVMKSFAEDLIDNIMYDANVTAEINNFNDTLKDAVKMPNIMSLYGDQMRDYYEKTLYNKAVEMKDSEDEKQVEDAEKIFKLCEAFTESYTYTKVKEAFLKNRKFRNRTVQDLHDFKKYCLNYDRAMDMHTTLTVRPAKDMHNALEHIFEGNEEITSDLIDKFIIVLCKYVDRYLTISEDNPYDSALAYYLTAHINNLAMCDLGDPTSLESDLIMNIKKFLLLIKKTEEEHLNSVN